MSEQDIAAAAERLLVETGHAPSAARMAGERIQTACNASEREFWRAVRALLEARRG